MSNHTAVTPDGLEIGRVQYLRGLAARAVSQARMNPVLLKPSANTHSIGPRSLRKNVWLPGQNGRHGHR